VIILKKSKRILATEDVNLKEGALLQQPLTFFVISSRNEHIGRKAKQKKSHGVHNDTTTVA
jgi:hypothetical protein